MGWLPGAHVLAACLAASALASSARASDQNFVVTMQCSQFSDRNESALLCPTGPGPCGPFSVTGDAFVPNNLGGAFGFALYGLPEPAACKTLLLGDPFCEGKRGNNYECSSSVCSIAEWSSWGSCEGRCDTGIMSRNSTLHVTTDHVPGYGMFTYCVEVVQHNECALRECEGSGFTLPTGWVILMIIIFSFLCIMPFVSLCRKKESVKPTRSSDVYMVDADAGDDAGGRPARRERHRPRNREPRDPDVQNPEEPPQASAVTIANPGQHGPKRTPRKKPAKAKKPAKKAAPMPARAGAGARPGHGAGAPTIPENDEAAIGADAAVVFDGYIAATGGRRAAGDTTNRSSSSYTTMSTAMSTAR